ncbi:uncharacterized protein EV420DRAFT_1582893 [Desarmillaria tabescens]|uniref:Uncharacterized protein n=1 Tax=Armillaria tabescens TaxID=1929756 RepID=A0AA39JC42_ARMTA|nr:uncharacterized protein EV420DRAFT_1582893 [Desarmillaria tabescens]KAK0440016.1 hypothetical protein EV420DRAFT_1582893 [Desarmillaria tabescens]
MPRVSKRPFNEIVKPPASPLPLTAWYKKGPDPVGASSPMCSSKRLKENHGGWSMPTTSGSVSSDNTDEEDASDCEKYVCAPLVLQSRVPIPVERPAVTIKMNRKILPLPKRAKLPASVDPRQMFLKSLIQPAQLPGEKAHKTDEERLYFLQQDPCVDVQSISRQLVVCNKCRKPVLLDRRRNAGYYASAWVKHKKTCLEVYRAWLIEHGYDDPAWIREAERRRDAKLKKQV